MYFGIQIQSEKHFHHQGQQQFISTEWTLAQKPPPPFVFVVTHFKKRVLVKERILFSPKRAKPEP